MFTCKTTFVMIRRRASLFFIAAFVISALAGFSYGQTSSPTPETDETLYNGYRLSSAFEFGWRWRSLDGNENKYRSDLNYKQGFRTFDTNVFLETVSGEGKYFDSLLFTSTGWGADPSGFLRLNMDKVGAYKFNFTTRRFNHFSNLSNFVAINGMSQHTQDWTQSFTDFDLTLLPQSEKLRLSFGGSFSGSDGTGLWTARGYRDDFPVPNTSKLTSKDFRFGAEGKLWGFNWGLSQGFRLFEDRSSYLLAGPHPGNNTTDTTVYNSYSKDFPTDGHGYFTQFNINRTFADKFDLTGRFIYSSTNSESNIVEKFTGRDNSNNFVDSDVFTINSRAKRPQSRGDVGITYRITDDFRISNTLSYDRFTVNGGENLRELFDFRNAANTLRTSRTVQSYAYRVNDFDRLSNTLEADYQVNRFFAFHAGWRYTKRKVDVFGLEGSVTTNVISPTPNPVPTPSVSSLTIGEDEENSTNTFIAGVKVKPTKHWVIFGDFEKGSADNIFSRLENYDFTNYRVRSRWSSRTVNVSLSAFAKDNSNPSQTFDNPPLPFGTDIKSRVFSGDVDWSPNDKVRFAGGYSYRNQTAKTPIYTWIGLVPTSGIKTLGVSEFYMKDHYGYVEMSAKPHRRVSLFATYRMNRDKGQGGLVSPPPSNSPNIIGSYPMTFNTPELRAAIRITRNVDWNVGYQYYNYKDDQTPSQSYKAHLPFTSLRIYFGGRAADR